MNMRTLKGEEPTGTDTEACAYLYTAALTQPMDHDWGQVYLYVANNKTYSRWHRNEVPEDIWVESLTDEQMRDLNRLKGWLLRKKTQARFERERGERREREEEEIAKREAEQPALFEF